jgi:hypothetical protein
MIIFGWGKNCKEIGKGLIRECPNCKNIRQWIIVQTSKKVTLYFVPVAKWNKEYFFICPVCNSGIQLNNLEEAHKIMEASLEQETELKKLYSETDKEKSDGNVSVKSSIKPPKNLNSKNEIISLTAEADSNDKIKSMGNVSAGPSVKSPTVSIKKYKNDRNDKFDWDAFLMTTIILFFIIVGILLLTLLTPK